MHRSNWSIGLSKSGVVSQVFHSSILFYAVLLGDHGTQQPIFVTLDLVRTTRCMQHISNSLLFYSELLLLLLLLLLKEDLSALFLGRSRHR